MKLSHPRLAVALPTCPCGQRELQNLLNIFFERITHSNVQTASLKLASRKLSQGIQSRNVGRAPHLTSSFELQSASTVTEKTEAEKKHVHLATFSSKIMKTKPYLSLMSW